jgi:hypothetical protein
MIRKILFSAAFVAMLFIATNAQSKAPKTLKINKTPEEKNSTIFEGRGVEGITVGKSTMNDVAQKLGKNYRWEVNKKYSYQMTYDRLGLSFYICQSDRKKEVFLIEIKSPFSGKTSKGITLGKSTKEETEKIYGKAKDGFEYRGVSFYYNTYGARNIISEIDVTETSGVRQCGETREAATVKVTGKRKSK